MAVQNKSKYTGLENGTYYGETWNSGCFKYTKRQREFHQIQGSLVLKHEFTNFIPAGKVSFLVDRIFVDTFDVAMSIVLTDTALKEDFLAT